MFRTKLHLHSLSLQLFKVGRDISKTVLIHLCSKTNIFTSLILKLWTLHIWKIKYDNNWEIIISKMVEAPVFPFVFYFVSWSWLPISPMFVQGLSSIPCRCQLFNALSCLIRHPTWVINAKCPSITSVYRTACTTVLMRSLTGWTSNHLAWLLTVTSPWTLSRLRAV